MGQSQKREIEIRTSEAKNYSVGEVVTVGAKQSLGVVAVVLCYVMPLIVLVATLAAAITAAISEGISALLSLGATLLYYTILYLFRKHISKRIIFTINKK